MTRAEAARGEGGWVMAKCRHMNDSVTVRPSVLESMVRVASSGRYVSRRCLDCGEWLSLGPAPSAPLAEMVLAERLSHIACLFEPGRVRALVEDGWIDAINEDHEAP